MREVDAIKIMNNLEIAIIKARSIVMETLGIEDPNENSAEMEMAKVTAPELFGPRNMLDTLHKFNERIRKGGELDFQAFQNMLMIMGRDPKIGIAYASRWGNLPDWRDLSYKEWVSKKDEEREQRVQAAGEKLIEFEEEFGDYLPGDPNAPENRSGLPISPDDIPPEPSQETKEWADKGFRKSNRPKKDSIFDFEHETIYVPMMVFPKDGMHPMSFMVGGTSIYDEKGEKIAWASPWLNGSLAVFLENPHRMFLIHVGHAFNAAFRYAKMDIDAFKIEGKRMDVTQPEHFDPPKHEYHDADGNELEAGNMVKPTITIDEAYAWSSDGDYVYARSYGSTGVIMGFEGAKVLVSFPPDTDEIPIYPEHLKLYDPDAY